MSDVEEGLSDGDNDIGIGIDVDVDIASRADPDCFGERTRYGSF